MSGRRASLPLSLPVWKKALYAAIPIGLLLVCLELAVRAAVGGRIQQITGVAEWEAASWQGLTYFWDQYDSHLGWTNLPGYRSDERVPFRVSINGQGLRAARDYSPSPAPGTRRIAVFGDSTAFGEEVDDDQTVPFHLERMLGKAEVLNFGVRGYGLGQMVLRLERDGFALEPEHVVALLLLPEDIHRDSVPFFTHSKPAFALREGGLTLSNHPVPVHHAQPWWLRHSFAAAWLWGRPSAEPEAVSREDAMRTARALVERIERECRERGVSFTLVPIATARALDLMAGNLARRREFNAMRASLAELAVDRLDLIAPLAGAYRARGAALVAPRGHWSGEGNQLIAEWIALHLATTHARGLRPTR